MKLPAVPPDRIGVKLGTEIIVGWASVPVPLKTESEQRPTLIF